MKTPLPFLLSFLLSISLSNLTQIDTATAQSPNVLTLTDFLASAQSQSPDVTIEKSINEEAHARANGLRISPPMIGLMNMQDSAGTNKGIEISQEIPFPTKLTAEKDLRNLEAKAQNSLYLYRKNEILLDARMAYFDFWKSFQTTKILEEKSAWLKNHVNLSRTTARSDSTAQIHLLGTESEADLMENDLSNAQAELIEKRTALKLYAPDLITTNLSPEPSPALESIEPDSSGAEPKNSSQKTSLNISWKEDELRAAEEAKSLKKQSYIPDIVLRYRSYEGNSMTPRNTEVMVGITLPFIFFGQPSSEVTEASVRTTRAQAELQKARLTFEARLSGLTAKSQSLKKQLISFKDKLVPRAHKRMKLVENLSARSMEGLDEHRLVMLDYLELKKKELDTRIEFEKTMIEISKLVNKKVEL